ncbi:MAG: class I SAM-dependent methyltransferase [Polyangiaceae bacterium]
MDQAAFDKAVTDGTWDWNDMYAGSQQDLQPPDPLVLETALALPPGRVLDVGCGAGGLLLALTEAGWQASGIDVARRAIAAERAVFAERGLSASLATANAATWTPETTFDLVTNSFALPNTKDEQTAALRMMRAAVAPGGTVVIKDFDPAMIAVTGLSAFHHATLDELVAPFDGFEILRAEVVDTPPHDHDGAGAHAGERWTASFVVARRG